MTIHKKERAAQQLDTVDGILDSVRWGDYQREDGTWGYGVANRAEIQAKLQQHIQAELASLLEELLSKKRKGRVYSPDLDRFSKSYPSDLAEVVPVSVIEYRLATLTTQLDQASTTDPQPSGGSES